MLARDARKTKTRPAEEFFMRQNFFFNRRLVLNINSCVVNTTEKLSHLDAFYPAGFKPNETESGHLPRGSAATQNTNTV